MTDAANDTHPYDRVGLPDPLLNPLAHPQSRAELADPLD
jgi:hypothetical protein